MEKKRKQRGEKRRRQEKTNNSRGIDRIKDEKNKLRM